MMQRQFNNACDGIERGIEDVLDRAAACDSVYDRISQGLEWVQQSVCGAIRITEPTTKERCVMVNEWNRGVFRKKLMIEAQTKGTPIETYEPKLLPGRTTTSTSSTRNSSTTPSTMLSTSRAQRLGRIRKGLLAAHSQMGPSLVPSGRGMYCTKALIDDGLSPIAEEYEDVSRDSGETLHKRMMGDGSVSSQLHHQAAVPDDYAKLSDDLVMWPVETRDDCDGQAEDDGNYGRWYTEKMDTRQSWKRGRSKSSYGHGIAITFQGFDVASNSIRVANVGVSRDDSLSDLQPSALSCDGIEILKEKLHQQFVAE